VRPEPTLLDPVLVPRIWGARSLAPLFPRKTNLKEPIGEAWLTGHGCRIASGPFAGKTLGTAWREMPPDWRGTRLAAEPEFPLLLKFLFPNDKLSIQVHPDDAYAAVHEQGAGARGKTEMWYAIAAETGAELLLGLKPGATREEFRAAIERGTAEELLERWSVRPGDAFFVPAGTPHTIGRGMTLCEVQEYSDLTYRVYDYGRLDSTGKPRALHVEKALTVMNFGTRAVGRVTPAELRQGMLRKTLLAACRYFAMEKWEFGGAVEARTGGAQFEILVVLAGAGSLEWSGGTLAYAPAQAWLLPAATGAFRLAPERETALLRIYVPDLDAIRSEWRQQGLDQGAVSRVVFD
jgi:mannose-6-phosphate isomerase